MGDIEQRRDWVAGASSFPQLIFHDTERAKAEAALSMCQSSSEEEEDDRQHVPNDRPGDETERNRHARKHHKASKHHKKRKRDKSDDPARLIKGDRGKIVRAEREAHASGLTLPEKRGSTIWASSSSSFGSLLGIPGYNAIDRDLMFSDKGGDLMNLAYLSLQAAHTPIFSRRDPLGLVRDMLPNGAFSSSSFRGSKPDQAPRYHHVKYMQAESSRKSKRIMITKAVKQINPRSAQDSCPGDSFWWHGKSQTHQMTQEERAPSSFAPEVIRLDDSNQDQGETLDEYILRRTGEHNKATRSRPHNLQCWLDFASFQTEAATLLGGKRGVGFSGGQEKRVDILQQALIAHPGNETLLSALLEASGEVMDAEKLCGRWQSVLEHRRGSALLWSKYIIYRKTLFSLFKASRLQVIYADALHDLSVDLGKKRRARVDPLEIKEREEKLVDIALDLVKFELEAGFTERVISRVQATIEFHCFNPNMTAATNRAQPPPAGAQLRQFELFFESGSPMVGESGGKGWAEWFGRSNRDLMMKQLGGAATEEDEVKEPEAGSWSGWEEVKTSTAPDSHESATEMNKGEEKEADTMEEEEGEGSMHSDEEGDINEQGDEDDEALLARLGVKLDEDLEAMQRRGIEPNVLRRWLQMERDGDTSNWLPARVEVQDDTGNESLIKIEDVRESVFPLSSDRARERLILCLLGLLGAPLLGLEGRLGDLTVAPPRGLWATSSASSLTFLGSAAQPCVLSRSKDRYEQLESIFDGMRESRLPWYQDDSSGKRREFLSRIMSLLISNGLFVDHPHLSSALLLVESCDIELLSKSSGAHMSDEEDRGARIALAGSRGKECVKSLLELHRDNVSLGISWGLMQAYCGKPAQARTILDRSITGITAVLTTDRRPLTYRLFIPIICLQYAEAELMMAERGNTAESVAKSRALHIIQWLLSHYCFWCYGEGDGMLLGQAFEPANASALSQDTEVKARMARGGFGQAMAGWMDDALAGRAESSAEALSAAVAIVCAAMRHEIIIDPSSGVKAALALFRNTLGSNMDPSGPVEWLHIRLCRMLVKEQRRRGFAITPWEIRDQIIGSLRLFPRSPDLVELLEESETLAHAHIRLRCSIHRAFEADPNPTLFASAIRCELRRLSSNGWTASSLPSLVFGALEQLFEKAALTPHLASSPVTWIWFTRLYTSSGKMEAARKVLLRGIRECPWSKGMVWMRGLDLLNGALPPKEMSDLLNVAGEKGLRMRVDVAEAMLAEISESVA